jgi:hypothetical protein
VARLGAEKETALPTLFLGGEGYTPLIVFWSILREFDRIAVVGIPGIFKAIEDNFLVAQSYG